MSRLRAFLCVLLCAALLSGCSNQQTDVVSEALPREEDPYTAPVGDLGGEYSTLVTLYLPSADGTQLMPLTEEMTFSSRPEAETVVKALLAHPAGEDCSALPGGGTVTLMSPDAVTVSGGVATVNLSVAALSLDHTDFFILCQALTNTLCAIGDIAGVNVLVAGVSPGLDVGATLPLGLMVQNLVDDPAMLKERLIKQRGDAKNGASFRINAALYFPTRSGRGIVAEGRMLALTSVNASDMALALLEQMSLGAEELLSVPEMPDLAALLSSKPVLDEGAQSVLRLSFKPELNDALTAAGITRSVMMASLVTTLTTFLPNVPLVSVSIGNEQITALTPSGLYSGADQTVGFSGGHMRRGDFSNYLLTEAALYFSGEDGAAAASKRALPGAYARSPRALFEQLLLGPLYDDTVQGRKRALPKALSSADLIGVRRVGDTLLLNFSAAFVAACQGLTPLQESAAVYAIVNTMTEMPGVRRVRFYVDGAQPDTLSGALALGGEFMRSVND